MYLYASLSPFLDKNEYASFNCGHLPSTASSNSFSRLWKLSPTFTATGPDTCSSVRYAKTSNLFLGSSKYKSN